eukprot:GDKI01028035.1.p1 GENE.GDKI01028035.1~~GDKI01028035.1.p1  ORF type:complete len:147 (+),score=21.03 GDKI01028035.1:132-572(+)
MDPHATTSSSSMLSPNLRTTRGMLNFQPPSPNVSGMKGRVLAVNNALASTGEKIEHERTELQGMKGGDVVVSQQLAGQFADTKRVFQSEMQRIEDEFKASIAVQRTENQRLQQQLTTLKAEKTSVHQQILAMHRRVEEIEEEIGHD